MRLRILLIACLLAGSATLSIPAGSAGAASGGTAHDGARSVKSGAIAQLAGPYHIQNINSGLCLASRAGSGERPTIQTTCDFTVGQYWADQYWELRYVSYAWQIYNRALRLCLVARGGGESAVVATTCGSWNDQLWYWLVASDGTEQFENVNSGLCLTARGSGESAPVATTCDWNANSYWPDQHWLTS
jgi:hypothetical protein